MGRGIWSDRIVVDREMMMLDPFHASARGVGFMAYCTSARSVLPSLRMDFGGATGGRTITRVPPARTRFFESSLKKR
jgi:hypothetical protein